MNIVKKSAIAAVLAALCAAPAWSASLGFNPSSATFNAGSGIDVDLVISDLAVGEHLAAFDFLVNFDSTVLGFDSYTLGSQLGSLAAFESFDTSLGQVATARSTSARFRSFGTCPASPPASRSPACISRVLPPAPAP